MFTVKEVVPSITDTTMLHGYKKKGLPFFTTKHNTSTPYAKPYLPATILTPICSNKNIRTAVAHHM